MPDNMTALVEAVKAHASKHYNDGGWDVVIECWEDSEISEHLAASGVTTPEGAVEAFAPLVDVWTDRQADAEYHTVQAIGAEEYRALYGHEPRWH